MSDVASVSMVLTEGMTEAEAAKAESLTDALAVLLRLGINQRPWWLGTTDGDERVIHLHVGTTRLLQFTPTEFGQLEKVQLASKIESAVYESGEQAARRP